ncbi:MAG: hypothetical protein KDN20_21505 [Verrucomicrobiae bacterium]|nr:hypothetical protein [Verrucomicrobiae bacterium]
MNTRSTRSLTAIALCAIAFSFSSCIENSTVVRVKKDGSGEIFSRYYFSPQMTGMLGMLNGLSAGLPGAEGAAPSPAPSVDDLLKPTRESLEADATSYGKGVRYQSHEIGKNANQWDGYLVVYQFDNINDLKIDPTKPPGPFDDLAKMNPQAAAAIEAQAAEGAEIESPVKFTMADGVLTIDTGVSPETLNEISEAGGSLGGSGLPGGGAISAPGGGEIDPAAAMQMAAGMFQGMRIAYFIRIEGEIAETNAQHVDGSLITMSDIQPAIMMADPALMAFTKEAEALQGQEIDQAKADAMMEKVKTIEGIKLETQPQITVRFK